MARVGLWAVRLDGDRTADAREDMQKLNRKP